MTDRRLDDPARGGDPGFDWDSPRWRENDTDRAAAERGRRSRVGPSPHQRGAIDEGGSVSGSHPSAEAYEDGSPDAPPETPRT